MGKKKDLSTSTRSIILFLHQKGFSQRDIAKEIKVSRGAVRNTINIFQESGGLESRKPPGKPRATSKREDSILYRMSIRDRRLTAPELTARLNETKVNPVSVSTVKRRLKDRGLNGRIALKKPLLRPQNKVKRLAWAKMHRKWSINQWNKVLWTDESKFQLFGSNRRVFVRRRVGKRASEQCTVATVKHGGGSVMVWGCFGNDCVGDLVKIDGIMKKEEYLEILQNNAMPSGQRIIGRGFTFQEDNDPKHSSKLCRGFLMEKQKRRMMNYMTWPPQSPDLNPIELLWEEMDRRVRLKGPTSKSHMWEILQESWNEIDPNTLRKLVEKMPD